MTNHLDTHYISWKYEIKAVVQRSSFVSTKHSIKRELFLRRPISPAHGEEPSPAIEDAKDLPKFFRSKVTIPPRIQQGAESMKVKVEMKARNKGYMVREVECFIVQTEDINYVTKASHPKIENAENPGVPLTVNGSRTVSNVLRKQNEDADLDFGHGRPLELDIRLDNNYLIPTEQGLSWLSITHAFEYKIHFMDVNLEPVTGHWPILVDHSVVTPLRKGKNGDSVAELAPLTVQSESSDEEQSIEAESGAHAGNEDGSEDNSDVSSDTSSTHSRSSFSALSKFMDTVWSGVERRLHRQPEVVV
ncbi:hypothetical protein BGW38_006821 [Lunasporangiospora selenospora]|uniref:Uncharacterized protein n=1 Tax=Lunasporangiospora selenospora TaxID=979761 RepID=A0A9P6KAH0_9FUNG|nr:hypothetical protein BGW38_006821 [Lunasporangiospora selenospora]